MKTCSTCKQELNESMFTKETASKDGLRSQCRLCNSKYKKKYREENPDRVKEVKTRSYLKNRDSILQRNRESVVKKERRRLSLLSSYGLNKEMYDSLREQQKYKCLICDTHEQDVKKGSSGSQETALHVDHCHSTNKVRGLLCTNCNTLIGKAKDNVLILHSAIKYLERNNT